MSEKDWVIHDRSVSKGNKIKRTPGMVVTFPTIVDSVNLSYHYSINLSEIVGK